MIISIYPEKQTINIWKSYKNTIAIQPIETDIDMEFAKSKVIPEIAKRYGLAIEDKKAKIKELQSQIDEIELSLLALSPNPKIKIYRADECPF